MDRRQFMGAMTAGIVGASASVETKLPGAAWAYDPLPSQRRFHGDMRSLYKGYSGPIGSGKSYALAYECLFLAALNPGLLGLIGAPTYPMLRDATLKTLFEVLELERIRYVYLKSENSITLLGAPYFGSQILCRSMDEYERLRGTNLAWFGMDELTYCPQEAWMRLCGRLRHPKATRRCGFAVWTPNGFDWVYRKFISEPQPGYKAVLASPRENRYVAATGMYESLASVYDERLYRQEVLGEYLSLMAGAAYYSFDRKQNVREVPYDRRLPLCWALDFNINPMCSIIGQIHDKADRPYLASGNTRDVEVRVLEEIHILNSNTPEACEEFAERAQKYAVNGGQLIVNVYGDATGNARQRAVGAGANSDWATVRQFFSNDRRFKVSYKYKAHNPFVKDRIAAVNAALLTRDGQRRLLIHPRCKHLIEDLEQVVFKEGTAGLDQTTNPLLTHQSDALGYLIETEMGFRQNGGARSTYVA